MASKPAPGLSVGRGGKGHEDRAHGPGEERGSGKRMRVLRYAAYLWPGLPQLWFEGAWSGLALALGFGVLLNGLLLASLVWVELITSAVRLVAWVALAVIWAGSGLFVAWSGGLRDSAAARQARDDLFRGALGEYLKGAWFEAETLLGELLAEDSRDVDARLMLASLLRHTRRPLEARRQLDELCRLEKAEKWRL
ncbi:MAG TPA: hypothetical protein VMF30_02710, partial [Pirellulales bacterium]|nr:hypothetical protein [Pirellulales bacterium]